MNLRAESRRGCEQRQDRQVEHEDAPTALHRFSLSDSDSSDFVTPNLFNLICDGWLDPGKVPSQDAFDDPVVGGGGGANAYANVDLPLGRDVEIADEKNLLLLIMKRCDAGDAAVVGVVFDAAANDLVEVVADFGSG